MKFEVLKVLMKNPVLRIWHHADNTGVYFVGTCCLHHQSSPWTSRAVLLRTLIQLVSQVCWQMKFWQPITLVLTTEDILWMCVIIFATDQLPWWHTTQGSLWSLDCVLAHQRITMLSVQRLAQSAIMIHSFPWRRPHWNQGASSTATR